MAHPNGASNVYVLALACSGRTFADCNFSIQNDCPGRIYDPGPGPLLDNFTVHLNNRNHRTNVSNRIMQEQGRHGGQGKE